MNGRACEWPGGGCDGGAAVVRIGGRRQAADAVGCRRLRATRQDRTQGRGGSYADRIACMYVIKVSNIHLYAIYMYGCLNTCKYVCIYCIWIHFHTNIHIHTNNVRNQNPSRACHIDKTNSFIAVGCTAGGITLYYLTDQLNKKGGAIISYTCIA